MSDTTTEVNAAVGLLGTTGLSARDRALDTALTPFQTTRGQKPVLFKVNPSQRPRYHVLDQMTKNSMTCVDLSFFFPV
jgi:hypothetical protein